MARPGYVSSAALERVGSSSVSIISGASTPIDSRLTTSRHLLGLVAALGERDADVEGVRAALHLLARDLQHAVVVVGQHQLLDRAASPAC